MQRKPHSAPHKFRTWLKCLELERRDVPSRPLPYPMIYVGAETGAPPLVKAYDAEHGTLLFERQVYESSFSGGVRVATGDFNADGFPDLVVGPGFGGGPRVQILDAKNGKNLPGPLGNFWAFDPGFKGGVEVEAADVNGDSICDLIVAAGSGGGPHVKVFDGLTNSLIGNFMAFEESFTGGVSLAAADFDGDGRSELVVGAGPGGGPRVRMFDAMTGSPMTGPLANFFAYDPADRGGVHVGSDWKTGDVTGDGKADLLVGPGADHAPIVRLYNGSTGALDRSLPVFESTMTAGVRVGMAYVTDDEFADIVVASGKGAPGRVKVFDGQTNQQLAGGLGLYAPFGETNTNGITLAASNDPPPPGGGGGGGGSGSTEYFTAPVTKSYPGPNDPLHATPIDNRYNTTTNVKYNGDSTRLEWEVTITNMCGAPPGDYGFKDFGISFFRMKSGVRDDVVLNSGGGWTSKLVNASGSNEEAYFIWQTASPLIPGDSYTFTFSTPYTEIVKTPTNEAASFAPEGDITGASFKYEAAVFQYALAPGKRPSGDLDIFDSNGIVVEENNEESPGGWISVNNDNDNYNFNGDPATSLAHKYDKDETSQVVGENDLIKIKVHNLVSLFLENPGVFGAYEIVWTSPNIKLWRSADKVGIVASGDIVPTSQNTEFWVEGIGLSASMLAEEIKLTWQVFGAASLQMDKVNFTVYEVKGVMNVPGYSNHVYRVENPIGSTNPGFVPTIVNVSSGQKKTESATVWASGPISTVATILWDSGPCVGNYRVTPGPAVNNFFVDREVNVVQIKIQAAGNTAGPAASAKIVQDATAKYALNSNPDPRATAS